MSQRSPQSYVPAYVYGGISTSVPPIRRASDVATARLSVKPVVVHPQSPIPQTTNRRYYKSKQPPPNLPPEIRTARLYSSLVRRGLPPQLANTLMAMHAKNRTLF